MFSSKVLTKNAYRKHNESTQKKQPSKHSTFLSLKSKNAQKIQISLDIQKKTCSGLKKKKGPIFSKQQHVQALRSEIESIKKVFLISSPGSFNMGKKIKVLESSQRSPKRWGV